MEKRPAHQPKRQPESGRSAADQLSLAELTAAADVTVRTVRYYIAEGLLPPPVTAGPQSHYTRGHLERLRLIARLKAAYLPLREIRRQLAGLDDAAVRQLLAEEERAAAPEPTSARDYLDQVLAAPHRAAPSRPPRPSLRAQRLPLADAAPPDFAGSASFPTTFDDAIVDGSAGDITGGVTGGVAEDDAGYGPARYPFEPYQRSGPLAIGAVTPLTPAPADALAEDAAPEAWRRVRLADDAELLIRESAYEQRRDRIDWLVRWARRVFR